MKWEIFTRKDKKTGVRLKGLNGEIVLAGEGYNSEGNARRAIKRVRAEVATAPIVVIKSKDKVDGA